MNEPPNLKCNGIDCGSNGIYAYVQAGNGSVDLTTAAGINTTGSTANGILAYAVNGNVTIHNGYTIDNATFNPLPPHPFPDSGGITTKGDESNGILAYANGGNVTVFNDGLIAADGQKSFGIDAFTTAIGNNKAGDVAVYNNSGIIKSGINDPADNNDNSGGIKASSTTTGSGDTGTVRVENTKNAVITAYGRRSDGIQATTFSDGGTGKANDVTVVSDTDTIDTEGEDANGIFAQAQSTGAGAAGNVTITSTGDKITTKGTNATAISAQAQTTSTTGGAAGNVTITSTSDDIYTDGTNANGIFAQTQTAGDEKAGNVSVTHTGKSITTIGDNATAIFAQTQATGTGAAGDVTITSTGDTIITKGKNATGLYAESIISDDAVLAGKKSGNVTIDDNQSNITTNDTLSGDHNDQAIYANSTNGNVHVETSGNLVTNSGSSTIKASAGGEGTVTIQQMGTVASKGTGPDAAGIWAQSADGALTIDNGGNVSTAGSDRSAGIFAQSTGSGMVSVTNSGPIETTGAGPQDYGIEVLSATGAIHVDNSDTIQTAASDGIHAETGAPFGTKDPVTHQVVPSISILNSKAITTTGGSSNAISAKVTSTDGDVEIENSGPLKAAVNGILAQTKDGPITVTNNAGGDILQASGDGIRTETEGGAVEVSNSATVFGQEAGVFAKAAPAAGAGATATFALTNGATGDISGANAGIRVEGGFTSGEITNDGYIHAGNDLAIDTHNMEGPVIITNNGQIDGYMTLAHVAGNIFNNNAGATWNLQNTKATGAAAGTVAVADMGGEARAGEGATVTNTGTINLVGNSGSAGEYVPLVDLTTTNAPAMTYAQGYAKNLNNSGTVQGQILGVAEFINAGTIDLTNKGKNTVAGNVLVISGGHDAGTDGGGVYVSDGGKLVMNTVYNEGGMKAQSDILVVDSTRVAGGATTIILKNPSDSLGADTGQSDGIPLVEVLRKGNNPDGSPASATGAFQLYTPDGRTVTVGAYQYTLQQNGYTNADGNWYLRSTMVQPQVNPNPPPQPPPPPPVQPPQPPGSPTPQPSSPAPQPGSPAPHAPAPVIIVPNYRPEVPVYMTAPVLAQRMGLLMLGTYHHRVGEDRPMNWRGNDPEADLNADAKAPAPSKDQATDCAETAKNRSMAAWGRVIGQTGRAGYDDHTYSQFRENGPDYNFDIGALQAGFDVLRAKHDDLTRDNAGLYLGFMRGTAEVNYVYSNIGRAGRVDMNGYSLGGYWTHKGVSEWYLDGVLQGTRYDQAEAYSEYTALNQKIYPNGYGLAASLEAGIPFGPRDGWRWEPQAQLIYQYVTLDNGADRYGWVEYGDTSTWYGRIGARLTKDWVRDQEKNKAGNKANCDDERKRSVWARINLWHSFGSDADTTFTALNGMGATTLTTSMGDTWGQLGLGISGQLSQRLTAYLTGDYNMALTDGNGEAFSGEVGLRYEF